MQKYMREFHKQDPSSMATMAKYIKSYQNNHEKYQTFVERQSEKVSKQNIEENHRIQKRSELPNPPPEIIKFELSDARIPNAETIQAIQLHNMNRALKMENQTASDRQGRVKKDMSIEESVMVKITHPITPNRNDNKKQKLMKELPIGVQNAITLALKKEKPRPFGLYKDYEGKRYAGTKYIFENTLPSHSLGKNWRFLLNKAKPVNLTPNYFQHAETPINLGSQYLSSKYVSVPSYKIPYQQEFYQPIYPPSTGLKPLNNVFSDVNLPQISNVFSSKYYHSPTISHPIPLLPAIDLPKEEKNLFQITIQPSIELPAINTNALKEQLKFAESLEEEKQRPQDSTSPILFPIGARQPKTNIYQNKTLHFATTFIHTDKNKTPEPEVLPNLPEPVLSDFSKFYKDIHLLSSNSYFLPSKDQTPIVEISDEVTTKIPVIDISPKPVDVEVKPVEKIEPATSFIHNSHGQHPDVSFIYFLFLVVFLTYSGIVYQLMK